MRHLSILLWLVGLAGLTGCAEWRGTANPAADVDTIVRPTVADSAFARLVERLSEPGGYFDTDNLISNERSYLHVVEKLHELDMEGGAYIGVGPDQNFSYIVHVRPAVAFIIDIRRDNLLQHLLFKALFDLARNRVEYLCLLHGRAPPDQLDGWNDAGIEEIVEYIDKRAADPRFVRRTQSRIAARLAEYGVPLSPADVETIRRFHGEFAREGLDLRFQSHGRRPRPYYPTYRQLILETDLDGRRSSYLARERHFQFVKSLQEANRIVPVVGDLAGDHALAAIGREIERRGLTVSAFYTSNVEDYLLRARSFEAYVENLATLPVDGRSVIVRSFFGRNFGYVHPQAVSGYHSVQLLQRVEDLLRGHARRGYRSYLDLVTRDVMEIP